MQQEHLFETERRKQPNLWLWGAIAFAVFMAIVWIPELLHPTPPPTPYRPAPATMTTERPRTVDCSDLSMDPAEYEYRCGDGFVEPAQDDGPAGRFG